MDAIFNFQMVNWKKMIRNINLTCPESLVIVALLLANRTCICYTEFDIYCSLRKKHLISRA